MRISPNPQNKESILSVDESKSTVLIANETLFFDYVHGKLLIKQLFNFFMEISYLADSEEISATIIK